jgi:hypothetical protein
MLINRLLTKSQLIEGIVGSILFPLLTYLTKIEGYKGVLSIIFTWFLIWCLRKIFVNLFIIYNDNINIKLD